MRIWALIFVGIAVLSAGTVAGVPALRWRTQIILMNVTGGMPHIAWRDLLPLLSPRSPLSLAPLAETRNPYGTIRNPYDGERHVVEGRRLFNSHCASCHAPDANGSTTAPALVGRELKRGSSDWALYRTIREGVPSTGMPAHAGLSTLELWRVVAFVHSLIGRSAGEVAEVTQQLTTPVSVSFEELQSTSYPGRDWLTYSGSYSGQRNSTLKQIDTDNVHQLALRWVQQLDGDLDMVQCSPLVRDGVMFFTVPPDRVLALDAATGATIWTFQAPAAPARKQSVGSSVNRGVAILGDRLFVGTWDARLIALSAVTGKLIWQTRVEEKDYHWISAAPLVIRDLVIIGTGFKIGHGVLRAYDAATGKERWAFDAVPQPGQEHHDTWPGNSWENGGASTWLTGTYDPEADLLYWGIGNPKPDYDASIRKGDNLYTNSVVALNASTGKLVWHFQFTPNDDHDWDSNQIPVLVNQGEGAALRKLLLLANRNGFYYVLDRTTGAFLKAEPFAHQTWTAGIDSSGRPIPLPETDADEKGKLIYPSNQGATNWWSPTFDPALNLLFVPVFEHGMVFFHSGNSAPADISRPFFTAVRAMKPESGELVWERRQKSRFGFGAAGGLLSTQGGLVFGGDANRFFALASRTGQQLWSVDTGGHVSAAPVSYEAGGQQFISIAAGRALFAFALPPAAQPQERGLQ